MPIPIATPVSLPEEFRRDLEALVRRQTAPVRLVCRARVAADPSMRALEDQPRSGRPVEVPLAVRLQLISLACSRATDDKTLFREVWSYAALQEALLRETGWKMSISEIGRILRTEDIRPHRVRMWLNSRSRQRPHRSGPSAPTTLVAFPTSSLRSPEQGPGLNGRNSRASSPGLTNTLSLPIDGTRPIA